MNILRTAMSKDLNGKWCLEVYTDSTPDIKMTEIANIGDQHFHYGENEDGFVRFGVSHDTPSMGHEPGYMWSSRCGVFNTMFNKRCIEVDLCTGNYTRWGCYYMTVDKAMELMPDDFHISLFDAHDEDVFLFVRDGEDERSEFFENWGYEYICPMFATK